MNDDYSFFSSSSSCSGLRRINRRSFIRNTGNLVALGSLPAYLNADAAVLTAGIDSLVQNRGIVLYRESDVYSATFAGTLAQASLDAVALSDDPVRQWRDGLFETPGKHNPETGTSANVLPLIGLTSWPDLLLVSGMATEQRKHVIVQMQHHVNSTTDPRWSAELAVGYLQLPAGATKPLLESFANKHTHNHSVKPGERTLFSWLIA